MTEAQLTTFLESFKLTSTGDYATVGKADVKRKMLAHYIKRGDGDYEMLGYKQESMSVASNYDTNTVTDVTGATYLDNNGKSETLDMAEYKVNPTKTKFMEEAIKLKLSDREEQMNDYTILTVYGYLRSSDNKCLAVEQEACTLLLDNDGGQGYVTSDVNITLSGIKKYGTVDEIVATPTFVEATGSI